MSADLFDPSHEELIETERQQLIEFCENSSFNLKEHATANMRKGQFRADADFLQACADGERTIAEYLDCILAN